MTDFSDALDQLITAWKARSQADGLEGQPAPTVHLLDLAGAFPDLAYEPFLDPITPDETDPHWHCAAFDDHNAAEEIDGVLICAFCGAAWVLCDPDTCPEMKP